MPQAEDPSVRLAAAAFALTALIGVVFTFQRAGISDPFSIPVFRHLVLYQDYYAIAPFMAALLVAFAPPLRGLAARLAAACGRHPWRVAGLTAAALAAGTQVVYHAHPLSLDEYSLVFQSKVFAAGRLSAAFPPAIIDWIVPPWLYEFFRVDRASGAVVSGYWPGFALLLTPFSALGAPWLLNPLIGGATVLVMHRIARKLFDDVESAGYVVLLTVASPAITINALSYYSLPARLLLNAIFMLLLLRPTPSRALLAGVAGSLALVLHNPAPHLLFALPWFVWLAFRPDRVRLLGALLAGYLPLCMLLGWGWAVFLDDFGHRASLAAVAAPAEMAHAFAQRVSGVIGWIPRPDSWATQLTALAKLWLWAAPALVAAALLGAWRLRKGPGVWHAMAASAALTFAVYFFVPFDQGHGWGARYLHSAWLVLPLFAVAGLRQAPEVRGYLAACALLGLAVLTPLRALQVERFVARHLDQLPAATDAGPRVVIVNPQYGYFSWDLVQNDPFLRGPEIRLLSRDPAQDRAMMERQFPQYGLLVEEPRGSVWARR